MKSLFAANDKFFFILTILSISTVIFIVYFHTLNGFFLSDDFINLNERPVSFNDYIHKFIPSRYPGIYRPLWGFFWYFDYLLWGTNPVGYHITNTILHILVSISVFFLTYCISEKKEPAFFSAMLFSIHPVHSETVVWISCRMDMICAFFYLNALIGLSLFLRRKSVILYLFSLFAFLGSLLTKEMALSLPFAAFMLILISSAKNTGKENLLEAVKLLLPFFLISVGYLVFRLLFYGQISIRMAVGRPELLQFFSEKGMLNGIYTVFRNITIVPGKILFFPFNELYFGSYSILVKIGFLLTFAIPLLFVAFSALRKIFDRMIIYGCAFIFVSSIPVFHVVKDFSDTRYFYLSSVGYSIIVGSIIWLFFGKIHPAKPYKLIIIGLLFFFNTAILMINNSIRNTAAQMAYEVPHQIKQMYPIFKEPNPILYIYGNLSAYKGIPIYAFGIENAFRLFYRDKIPFAYIISKELSSTHDVTVDFDLRNCYTDNSFLMYWDPKLKSIYDLTDKFKREIKEQFEKIDPEGYPRWESEEILNSTCNIEGSDSRLHLISPRINVPLVGMKAIEIEMRIEPDTGVRSEKGEISLFIGHDGMGEPDEQYLSFTLLTDGNSYCYTFPFKISDIKQIDEDLLRFELKVPRPQKTIKVESIRIVSFKKLKEVSIPIWNFKNDYNLWNQGNGTSMTVFKEAPCLVTGVNDAPIITSPRLDIPIKELKLLKLKMRMIPKQQMYTSQQGKLFWITDTDGIWEEKKKCLLFQIIPDEKFHTYEILFPSAGLEQKDIKLVQLKLYLSSFPSEVEIGFIELVNT